MPIRPSAELIGDGTRDAPVEILVGAAMPAPDAAPAEATAAATPMFADREPTQSSERGRYDRDPTVTGSRRFDISPTTTTTAPPMFASREPTATAPASAWDREATVSGVARLADVIKAVDRGLVARTSYTELLTLSPSAIASRFDDDATAASAAHDAAATVAHSAGVHAAPGDDEHVVEADAPRAADSDAPNERIDDDLAEVTASGMSERRRTVVVAAIVSGGTAEARRPLAKSLGELAYQRGGVVVATDGADGDDGGGADRADEVRAW